jgi:hypothetical protein
MPVADDPLLRMPGTQPNQVSVLSNRLCDECHVSWPIYKPNDVFRNWRGSMMGQAARDFLMFACVAVAGQDSAWALGNPNAVDICERCHFPRGWLEGRSEPPNISAMTGSDYDGVQCSFCHIMGDPFFTTTYNGTREGNDWAGYWDEQNNPSLEAFFRSQPNADITLLADRAWSPMIALFNTDPFYVNFNPFSALYTENAAGQYFVSPEFDVRRGPVADSFYPDHGSHPRYYSRYHKSKFFCSTCHDVSNPALANLPYINQTPGPGASILHTERYPAYSYFHVERTFSEFRLSAYDQQGGAPGVGPFAPTRWNTSKPGNYIAACQDCHMRDVTSWSCDDGPVRPTGSPEHPNSGMDKHDMTGGNIWVPTVLASTIRDSSNYDATNAALLNQGPLVLTLDFSQGTFVKDKKYAQSLLLAANRARLNLRRAATIQNVRYNPTTGRVAFRIRNNTGHKLISGFPEGRRMFVNIKAFNGANLIWEVNPYDYTVGTLKGLSKSSSSPPLGPNEQYVDQLVYEVHPKSSITNEDETFHFVLATGRSKDNRIPPKGFRIAEAAARLSEPVYNNVSAPDYFTAAEYAGGYDALNLRIAQNATRVEVRLYYQTTSREYIEFLRDEINGTGNLTLPASAYIIQTNPFFSQLKAWGDTIWQLWDNNKNIDGAKPYQMTMGVWP